MSAALRGVGITSPAGHDLAAFRAWWRDGRPSVLRPSQHLAHEEYLPVGLVGEVPNWRPRKVIPERKSIKLMFPRVQLGVAAALEAWGTRVDALPPPERRAMYVACGLTVDEDWTFREAIEHSIVERDGRRRFDLPTFAREGQGLLNPLWLVKGLSNNVLAFVAKFERIMGPNDNFMAGPAGGLQALGAAAGAITEGRADIALCGGSDSLVTVEDLIGFARQGALDDGSPVVPAQGGGFGLLTRGEPGDFGLLGIETAYMPTPPPGAGCGPPAGIEGSIDRAAEAAWDQVGRPRAPGAKVRGPRLPDGPGDVDLWSPLGDPGAAVGGWLSAAAWALRYDDGVREPIELVAASNNGEVAVAVLGTLA